MEIITGNDEDKEYFGLHATGLVGGAFQVCTTYASIYIKFVKLDVNKLSGKDIRFKTRLVMQHIWFKSGLKWSIK